MEITGLIKDSIKILPAVIWTYIYHTRGDKLSLIFLIISFILIPLYMRVELHAMLESKQKKVKNLTELSRVIIKSPAILIIVLITSINYVIAIIALTRNIHNDLGTFLLIVGICGFIYYFVADYILRPKFYKQIFTREIKRIIRREKARKKEKILR